jgi:hypothetical protein
MSPKRAAAVLWDNYLHQTASVSGWRSEARPAVRRQFRKSRSRQPGRNAASEHSPYRRSMENAPALLTIARLSQSDPSSYAEVNAVMEGELPAKAAA